MQLSEKTKIGKISTTKFEQKLLADLFESSAKVSKMLNNVIRSVHHFSSAEMDLLTRLSTLFSEVSKRAQKKETEK